MAKSTTRSDAVYSTGSLSIPKKESGDLLYYILMAIIIFALIGGIILIGGMLRLTLAIFILFLIGLNLIYWSIEKTENTAIWERKYELNEEVNLKLKKHSDLVRRAFQGMELSQGLLEKKISDLYFDKLKDKKNLSDEEIRELLSEPEELRRVVNDEIISDFILSKKETDEVLVGNDEIPSKERLKGEDYEQWISRLLKRVDKWG